MAAARARGWDWISDTAHQRWTQYVEDGVETVGYWFPARDPSTRTVVLLHGHRADASLMGEFGRWYRRRGFNVFLADARGHGMSGGNYVGMGVLEQRDYLGWLRRVVSTVGGDAKVVLHGLSMGASTALMLSAHPHLPTEVKAVIADSGFTTIKDELAHQLRLRTRLPRLWAVNVASLLTRLAAGYWFAEGDARAAVATTTRPILVIHGSADTYNPTWMAHSLYGSITSPKQLWLAHGAGHGEPFFTCRGEYEKQVVGFIDRHLLAA
jgi:fermentation-respiration switch protein FrsA (DUF1100 family)